MTYSPKVKMIITEERKENFAKNSENLQSLLDIQALDSLLKEAPE